MLSAVRPMSAPRRRTPTCAARLPGAGRGGPTWCAALTKVDLLETRVAFRTRIICRPRTCDAVGMRVRRVVPDFQSPDPRAGASFYSEVLGLELAMDLGWIVTF